MTSYQNIEIRIKEVSSKTAQLAYMNKEQIFDMVAEIIDISDNLNNYIRDLDREISEAESNVMNRAFGEKITASMLSLRVKSATASLKADKEWAERQVTLMSELRMAALAAQRSAE